MREQGGSFNPSSLDSDSSDETIRQSENFLSLDNGIPLPSGQLALREGSWEEEKDGEGSEAGSSDEGWVEVKEVGGGTLAEIHENVVLKVIDTHLHKHACTHARTHTMFEY